MATTAPLPGTKEAPETLEALEREPPWLERVFGPETYRLIRGLLSNRLSIIGLVMLALFALVAIFAWQIAPPLTPNDPFQIPRDGFSPNPRPPGAEWNSRQPPPAFWLEPLTGSNEWKHFLGTASGQWDIFYGVVWGTRTAFQVGIIITAIVVTIGIIVGTVAAYYGGAVDNVLMRITDIFYTFPFLMAAITLAAILTPRFGKSIWPAMIALTTFGWMGYARLIRSDVLSVKERDYIMAARVIGAKDTRIIWRHIVPNAIFPTMVVASMDVGSYVITFAALSFLGIGVEVGYADWGQLLSFARDWITQLNQFWYMVVFPGLALIFFVLAWNLVGDAVRDILDPRMRGRGGA